MVYKFNYITAVLFVLLFNVSCSTVRVIKPLGKGVTDVSFSAGGPIIGLGNLVLPIPMSSLSVSHGVSDKMSLYGGLHLTSLLFGVGHIDAGMAYGFIAPKGLIPGVQTSLGFHAMLDKWESQFRLYPQVNAHAYWNSKNQKHTYYFGLENWFELSRNAADGLTQETVYIPTIYLGDKIEGKKLNWNIEVKYVAPNYKNNYVVVDYKGLGTRGAFGLNIGVSKYFGR